MTVETQGRCQKRGLLPEGKPHGLVVAVANPERETYLVERGFETEHAEQLHASSETAYSSHDIDVPVREAVQQVFDELGIEGDRPAKFVLFPNYAAKPSAQPMSRLQAYRACPACPGPTLHSGAR